MGLLRGRRIGVLLGVTALVGAASVGFASATPGSTSAQNPGAPRVATGAIVQGTPCTSSARACVDIAGRRTWLIKDGAIALGPTRMRPGDAEKPTPRGVFAVQWKAEQWTSREYHTQMPYAVFFAPGGVAFHEGPMDTPSAGCVKLVPGPARTYFDTLQVGDEVQVH